MTAHMQAIRSSGPIVADGDARSTLEQDREKLEADKEKLQADKLKHDKRKGDKDKSARKAKDGPKETSTVESVEKFKILPISFHASTVHEVTVSFAEFEESSRNMSMKHTFTGEKDFKCMVLLQQFVSTYNIKHPYVPLALDEVAIYVNSLDVSDESLASAIAGRKESHEPGASYAKVNSLFQVRMKNNPPPPQPQMSRGCGIAMRSNKEPLKLTIEYSAHDDKSQHLTTVHSVALIGRQEPLRTLLNDFVSVYNANRPSNQLDINKLALYYGDNTVLDSPLDELYRTTFGANDFTLQPNLVVRHSISCILVSDDGRLKTYGTQYMFHVTEPRRTFNFGHRGVDFGTMKDQIVEGKRFDVIGYQFVNRSEVTEAMAEQAALNTDQLLDHLKKAAKSSFASPFASTFATGTSAFGCCAVR